MENKKAAELANKLIKEASATGMNLPWNLSAQQPAPLLQFDPLLCAGSLSNKRMSKIGCLAYLQLQQFILKNHNQQLYQLQQLVSPGEVPPSSATSILQRALDAS